MDTVTLGGRPWGAIAAPDEVAGASRCGACCSARAACVSRRVLTACADPNNLPFSNKAGQGFENKLAADDRVRPSREAQLCLVGAAARLCPQHAERARMRLLAGRRQQCRDARHQPALLSLDLHVREPRRARPQGPDARRPAAEAFEDRRPDGRQRRRQHAARPCPRAARDRRQRPRLHALRRLFEAQPAGRDRARRRAKAMSTSRSSGGRSPAISRRSRRCRYGSSR